MAGRNSHRKALEKIAANPEKFGFKGVLSVSIEPTLSHGKRQLAQPDLVLELKKKEIHIVEYKSNGDEKLLERARKQLENAVWWYGRYREDILPESIYTHIISGTDPEYKDLLR